MEKKSRRKRREREWLDGGRRTRGKEKQEKEGEKWIEEQEKAGCWGRKSGNPDGGVEWRSGNKRVKLRF